MEGIKAVVFFTAVSLGLSGICVAEEEKLRVPVFELDIPAPRVEPPTEVRVVIDVDVENDEPRADESEQAPQKQAG